MWIQIILVVVFQGIGLTLLFSPPKGLASGNNLWYSPLLCYSALFWLGEETRIKWEVLKALLFQYQRHPYKYLQGSPIKANSVPLSTVVPTS